MRTLLLKGGIVFPQSTKNARQTQVIPVTLFHSVGPIISGYTAPLERTTSKKFTIADASAAALLFRSQSCCCHEPWEAAGRAAWLSGQMQTASMMWSPLLVQRQALQQCVLSSTSHANAAEAMAYLQHGLMIYQIFQSY